MKDPAMWDKQAAEMSEALSLAGHAIEDCSYLRAAQHAGGSNCLPSPRNPSEIPQPPKAEIDLGSMREQGREGLDFADLDAGRFGQHFARVARTELPARVKIKAGVVEDPEPPLCRGEQPLLLLRCWRGR